MKSLKYAGLAALLGLSMACPKPETRQENVPADYTSVCSLDDGAANNIPLYADSKSVRELTPENFDNVALENKLPVVVKFYAEWCAPCRNFKPIFESVCAEYAGRLVCAAYNVDQNTAENDISSRYGVRGIPAARFFHDGIESESRRLEGGRPEEILRTLFDEFLRECGH